MTVYDNSKETKRLAMLISQEKASQK